MATYIDIVNETAIALAGYTNRQDQATFLTGALTPTALTFTVADGTVLTRGLVEIDDELIWVDSFDRTTNTATIPSYGRGFRDTTATTHAVGTRVTIAPTYPRSVIRRNINLAIQGVYPDLFGTYYTDFKFQAAVTTYPIPNEAIDVLNVSWQTIGPSKEWLPIRHYRLDRQADPIVWNTGKTVSIREGIIPGRTVHVVYTKVPSELQYDTDDFATITGLEESAREVIVLGAAYRTAMYLDMGRVPMLTAEADSQSQSNPIGSAANIGRMLQQMYQQRLSQEVRRMQAQFPPRVHYTS